MTDPKYVLFYGDDTPRLKRPPAEGEIYLWTKPDGSKLHFIGGQWLPVPTEPEELPDA